jgi:hypothetical protein
MRAFLSELDLDLFFLWAAAEIQTLSNFDPPPATFEHRQELIAKRVERIGSRSLVAKFVSSGHIALQPVGQWGGNAQRTQHSSRTINGIGKTRAAVNADVFLDVVQEIKSNAELFLPARNLVQLGPIRKPAILAAP